jgi:predicted transcriptional regulator YdeE
VIPGYHDVPHLFQELGVVLRTQGIAPDARTLGIAVYHDTEYRDQGIDVEAAVPLPGSRRARVLPGAEHMACVIHQGGYESLPRAYNTLLGWIEVNGYRMTGPNRDIFLQGLWAPADRVTEVQFPVERKPIYSLLTRQKEKQKVEPKIVTKAAFTVVGMLYQGKNEKGEIPLLWREFNPRMREIQRLVPDCAAYGVCGELDEEDGTFKYVAGLEVDSADDIPEGMVSWDVPGGQYAVFPCTIETIGQAYEYAFKTWLPQSGYEHVHGPDFEYYGEEFDPRVDGSQLYIYIPVKHS